MGQLKVLSVHSTHNHFRATSWPLVYILSFLTLKEPHSCTNQCCSYCSEGVKTTFNVMFDQKNVWNNLSLRCKLSTLSNSNKNDVLCAGRAIAKNAFSCDKIVPVFIHLHMLDTSCG